MNILCLGDIVGPAAASFVCKNLWSIRREHDISFVVANGENADNGNGITANTASDLLASGVDVITSGNHIWQKSALHSFLDECKYILRPVNYPPQNPGHGWVITEVNGLRILVINVQGVIFMESLASPFETVEHVLSETKNLYDISILDIHAEATSEKAALAHYFDGKINIIYGTHTHVATADERILPGGTAFITDLGMCGVLNSALGVKFEPVINKMRFKLPQKFEFAEGNINLCGAIFVHNIQKNDISFVKRVNLS